MLKCDEQGDDEKLVRAFKASYTRDSITIRAQPMADINMILPSQLVVFVS